MTNPLPDTTIGLSRPALRIGEMLARKLFDARGNHTEAHLSERELALAIAAGAEVATKLGLPSGARRS